MNTVDRFTMLHSDFVNFLKIIDIFRFFKMMISGDTTVIFDNT